jgi:hypothetical protein
VLPPTEIPPSGRSAGIQRGGDEILDVRAEPGEPLHAGHRVGQIHVR